MLLGVITIAFIAWLIVKNEEAKEFFVEQKKNEQNQFEFFKNSAKKIVNSFNVNYNIKSENNQQLSFKKGEIFEDFTQNKIFTGEKYVLLDMTANHNQNQKRYVVSSMNPDFKFQSKKTFEIFWIECKFRSWSKNKTIEIISENQLKRHQKIKEPVYVFLGIGWQPNNPIKLFLIPIHECRTHMTLDEIYKFKY